MTDVEKCVNREVIVIAYHNEMLNLSNNLLDERDLNLIFNAVKGFLRSSE